VGQWTFQELTFNTPVARSNGSGVQGFKDFIYFHDIFFYNVDLQEAGLLNIRVTEKQI
jgi:hypothetical protein